jgi:hypothetical protein
VLVEAGWTARRALAVAESALGPDHPELAPILYGLGDAVEERGRPDDARALFERSFALEYGADGRPE